jgi:hypothetical protein
MANSSEWAQPLSILALMVLVGVFGIVLYYVIPVFGTAAGLFVAVSAGGLATAGAVSSWVAPTASGGIAVIGITVAGACYRRRSFGWKLVAVGLYLLPPLTLLGWSALMSGQATFMAAFRDVSLWTWMGLGILLMIGILIGILTHVEKIESLGIRMESIRREGN